MKTDYVFSPIPWSHLSWKTLHIAAIFLSVVLAVSSSQPIHAEPPIPGLATWQEDLLTFGERQCHYYREPGWEGGNGDPYYDGARVFFQASDYFGNPLFNGTRWEDCGKLAAEITTTIYQNNPPTSGAMGHNVFTTGPRLDFQRHGDTRSRDYVMAYGGAAWALDNFGDTRDVARENAYALLAILDNQLLGGPPTARRDQIYNALLGMFQSWFGGTSPPPPCCAPNPADRTGIQSMMVGLAAEALIRYAETFPASKPQVLTVLQNALPKMYQWSWRANQGGFVYDLGTDHSVQPGLNLLVAPAYAWAYRTTGDTRFRDWGDEIFSKGVCLSHNASTTPTLNCGAGVNSTEGGYFWLGKQFNQQYRWSFKYVEWRQGSGGAIPVPAPPQNLNVQ